MTRRQTVSLGCVAAVLAGWPVAAPPAQAAPHRADGRIVVHPGESIQRAVDTARPGDTVVVLPGVYRESVLITTSHLTLRGVDDGTVIAPGGTRAASACGQNGDGICVIGAAGVPIRDVQVRSLTVEGFRRNGLWASGTEGLRVHDVVARHNGRWGIGLEKSVHSAVRDNDAAGNGDAGIFLANSADEHVGAIDSRGTLVTGNHLTGNRIGLTVRRLRNLLAGDNTLIGNCAGMFVVGDENRPRAGALTVAHNEVSRNNRSCPATRRMPAVKGAGIVLTGVEEALIERNLVQGNVGTSPLSGGIVLFHSFVNALNERNLIRNNVVLHNSPADLVNKDPEGRGNRFVRNICRTSRPAGLCPADASPSTGE
ncbi:right-handed parallel beta-helix repeat-containing protein [Streptomyces sp. YGL11-2]|uniref:right-handed parallel beta-helix repeat-containing protein n=1 Tax=Streptomyces sp. YGL11-2 TaxID=3414028 RepID=UPI003CF4E957